MKIPKKIAESSGLPECIVCPTLTVLDCQCTLACMCKVIVSRNFCVQIYVEVLSFS